jgi:hypothetical protein
LRLGGTALQRFFARLNDRRRDDPPATPVLEIAEPPPQRSPCPRCGATVAPEILKHATGMTVTCRHCGLTHGLSLHGDVWRLAQTIGRDSDPFEGEQPNVD